MERQQRRLAAILAADVAGYSRLMAADESGTLARFNALRSELLDPKIAQFKGRLVGSAGDSLLVEFGSAVDAVQCAVEAQERIAARNADIPEDRRIVFRMGINLGDVIAEGATIHGDGVNVAARLERLAEPGGVVVSRAVHEQVKGRLACGFDDLGDLALHNIAEPVRAFRLHPSGSAPATTKPEDARRQSIAVLCFDNMSSVPEHDYICQSISENLITDLSRFRDLFVVARNSSFAYRGRSMPSQQIHRELQVDYVLEGSVQRLGDRLRITAQLIEAATGRHIWAERYDRSVDDLFAVMDEVTQMIVGTLATTHGGRLRKEAGRRSLIAGASSVRVFNHFLQGMEDLNRFTRESVARSLAHFEAATRIDPSYAKAHAKTTWAHLVEIQFGWSRDPGLSAAKAREAAEAALRCDDAEAWAYWALAGCAELNGRRDLTLIHMNRALELNPNDADILADMGFFYSYAGRADEGLAFALKAMRINPHHPEYYKSQLGQIYCDARQYAEAIKSFEAVRTLDTPLIQIYVAVSHAALGHAEAAKKAVVRLLEMEPTSTVAYWTTPAAAPYQNDADRLHLAQYLTIAGLPPGEP